MAEIIPVVSEVTGVRENEIRSSRQRRDIARARHLVCFMARELTSMSFTQIARLLNRDHTTIMHGCNKIDSRRHLEPALAEQIKIISARLGA